MKLTLSRRLSRAVQLAGKAETVADIGTDHAYIPIYMLCTGLAGMAVATDINRGPLDNAEKNAVLYGVSERLTLELCDGLRGIEKYSPELIFIAGMGGELIARIISEADFLKKIRSRLILQPMTRSEKLRAALIKDGFEITREARVRDGKLYSLLEAVYTGASSDYSEAELLVGKKELCEDKVLLSEHTADTVRRLRSCESGLLRSGSDAASEKAGELRLIIRELEARINGEPRNLQNQEMLTYDNSQ